MTVRCIVFDFDGTLVDTNDVKRDAYAEALSPLGVPGELCRDVLAARPDDDRFGVIHAILTRWRGAEPPADDVAALARTYGDICAEAAVTRPEIPGAMAAIEALGRQCRLYINSATPESSLRRIVERRGWRSHFVDVLGRPLGKAENLKRILEREAVRPAEVVMVGDGPADQAAADEVDCSFIPVVDFPRELLRPGDRLLRDLTELPAALAAISPQSKVTS